MTNHNLPASEEDEDEDDYLNMTFDESSTSKKETSLQKTARLKKEAAERGRIPSKAEKEALATAAREKALSTSLSASSSKGAAMMAKMGFIPGSALGAAGNQGRVNPIEVQLKDDKGGIGMDSAKKRKVREAADAAEEGVKRVKLTEQEYRERESRDREEKRCEGLWWGSMKVLEGFEESMIEGEECPPELKPAKNGRPPTKSVNLLYRPLVASRVEQERERRARYDLTQSLSQNPDYTDDDADDKLALGAQIEDDDVDADDLELEVYEAQPASEKLERVVKYLREKWRYCFWCKFRYEDEEMEGCPGLGEEEHG